MSLDQVPGKPLASVVSVARPGVVRINVGGAAPASAGRKIMSSDDVPAYDKILSATDGPFALKEHLQYSLAAIQLRDRPNEVVILATEAEANSAHRAELARCLGEAKIKIIETLIVDQGILHSIVDSGKDANDAGVSSEIKRDFQQLVEKAVSLRVSDIHLVGKSNTAEVWFRRYGELRLQATWSRTYMTSFINSVHFMADEDAKEVAFSDKEYQSMTSGIRLADGSEVKLRIQTLPIAPVDLCVVARVLQTGKKTKAKQLEELGYAKAHIDMFKAMFARPSGVIVLAGVTGSGKTTTLQTCMTDLRAMKPGAALYTVEDPPEYIIEGVRQVPVVRSKETKGANGNPFANAMRALMRADPDIAMVGEVRDSESANCLVNMVQTGHLVLTTIHARSAVDIVSRVKNLDMNMEDFCAPGFIAGLVYQTLVPVLCPHCKVPYVAPDKVPGDAQTIHDRIKVLPDIDTGTLFVKGSGCSHCDSLGVIGQTVCAEILLPTDEMLGLLRDGNYAKAKEKWRQMKSRKANSSNAMAGVSALEHAIQKMREGLVAPEAVESCLGQLTGDPASAIQIMDEFNEE